LICSGPVELAAAGVSIALFNQASRITIFPLVSITTSFVAEEDTLEKLNNKSMLKEVIVQEDHILQDIEKGSLKENKTSEKPMVEKCELKNLEVESFGSLEIGDGNFSLLIPFCFTRLPNIYIFLSNK